MRKKILSLVVVALIVSCVQSPDEKIKGYIDVFINKQSNYPETYELIDLELLWDVSMSDVVDELEWGNLYLNGKINDQQNEIFYESLTASNDVFTGLLKERTDTIKRYKDSLLLYIKELKKIKNVPQKLNTIGYVYKHTYKLENSSGSLDTFENYILLDENYKLISILNYVEELNYRKLIDVK